MKFDTPNADEFPFIFDSWARSFRDSPYAGCIRNCDYDHVSRAGMAEIIDRAVVTVAVQDTPDGQRRIAGYAVYEPDRKVLHYIYVKRDFRGMGVGRSLRRLVCQDVDLKSWRYTYRTNASERFLRVKGAGMKWDTVPARVKP